MKNLYFLLFTALFVCTLNVHAETSKYQEYLPWDDSLTRHTGAFERPEGYVQQAEFDGMIFDLDDYAEMILSSQIFSYGHPNIFLLGYTASPNLKKLDPKSTKRQKLILSDGFSYEKYVKSDYWCKGQPVYIFDPCHYTKRDKYQRIQLTPPLPGSVDDREPDSWYWGDGIECMANNLIFDFDLSEYACDFDIYILISKTRVIYDNAFSNFKMSDNIKSINIYFGGYELKEIGHNAFSNIDASLVCIEDMCKFNYDWIDYTPEQKQKYSRVRDDYAYNANVYKDSFSKNTYDYTPLRTLVDKIFWDIAQLELRGPNFYTLFKNQISGVENIHIDESEAKISVDGHDITVSGATPYSQCTMFSISGMEVNSVQTDAGGNASLSVNQPGVYIVRVGNQTAKVVVK